MKKEKSFQKFIVNEWIQSLYPSYDRKGYYASYDNDNNASNHD
jgi:hypothetical protein